MAIYMKFHGIEGDITTKGFEKQIEILSFSFGANRNIKTAAAATLAKAMSRA